jgi:hypothetical protein
MDIATQEVLGANHRQVTTWDATEYCFADRRKPLEPLHQVKQEITRLQQLRKINEMIYRKQKLGFVREKTLEFSRWRSMLLSAKKRLSLSLYELQKCLRL